MSCARATACSVLESVEATEEIESLDGGTYTSRRPARIRVTSSRSGGDWLLAAPGESPGRS